MATGAYLRLLCGFFVDYIQETSISIAQVLHIITAHVVKLLSDDDIVQRKQYYI